MSKRHGDVETRFWSRISPEPNSGCWLWDGTTDDYGYGRIRVNGYKSRAHRYSFELHYHKVPHGFCVLHRCDMPWCVNPDHLFLGTHRDNIADMVAKKRNFKISELTTKVTPEQAAAIRQAKGPQREIAAKYGIAQPTVSAIKTGRRWANA
jgi:predicted XRE-type DNA-binding protein